MKDKMGFSRKNKSQMKVWGPMHVVIFSNEAPDTAALTADRWEIIDLANEPYPDA